MNGAMTEFVSAVIQGTYLYCSIPAALVIIYRIHRKLWTPAETVLLTIFFMHMLLQFGQAVMGGKTLYISRRYLLPCAPLLFGWAAWGIRELYTRFVSHRGRRWRVGFLVVVSLCTLALIGDAMGPTIKRYTSKKKIRERKVTAAAVDWIVADCKQRGKVDKRRNVVVNNSRRYLYRRRPWVGGKWSAIGYWSGGCHYSGKVSRCDYVVLPQKARPPRRLKLKYRFDIHGENYCIYGK